MSVADLRGKPRQGSGSYDHDDFRASQILYNEALVPMGRRSGWFHVEAREQKRYVPGIGWTGYYGWVAAGCVIPVRTVPDYDLTVRAPVTPIFTDPGRNRRPVAFLTIGARLASAGDPGEEGSFLRVRLAEGRLGWIDRDGVQRRSLAPDSDTLRKSVVATALSLVGVPYLWGGRSAQVRETLPSAPRCPTVPTGTDCSGLTNLVFAAHGMNIPRNAHDQWLWAEPIEPRQCLKGDLIFLAKEGDAQTVTHVMLFTGGEEFVEGPETGGVVRCATFQEKFGLSRQAVAQAGWEVNGKKLYCGSIVGRKAE